MALRAIRHWLDKDRKLIMDDGVLPLLGKPDDYPMIVVVDLLSHQSSDK
jgi:hypothetical protein